MEDNAITELVAKQKAAGLHVITDGEFRRGWWHLDCMWGFAGVEKVSMDKGYFFHDEETRAESARLTSKIAFDPAHPFVEHFKFIKQFEDDTAIARQTIPAPAQLYAELFRPENIASVHEFYGDTQKDYDELADDNAKAFHGLIMHCMRPAAAMFSWMTARGACSVIRTSTSITPPMSSPPCRNSMPP